MSKSDGNNQRMDSPTAAYSGRDTPGGRSDIEDVTSQGHQAGDASGQDVTGRDFAAASNTEKVLRLLEPETRERFAALGGQFRDDYRSSTRKYIADVFLARSDEFNCQAIGYLAQRVAERSAGFFGYSVDGDHVHIIHDCSYSGRSCRCRFREVLSCLGHVKRNERFVRNCSDIQQADWTRILIYYFLAKRGLKELSNQGLPIRLRLDAESIHDRESICEWAKEFRQEQALRAVSNADPGQNRNKRSIGTSDVSSEEGLYGTEPTGEGFHGKKSKREPIWNVIREQVYRLLEQFHPAPLQTIRSVEAYKQSSILTNPKHDAYVNKALQLYSDRLIDLSVRDFYELLMQCPEPIFYKGVNYGNIEESSNIIDQLIRYQFDDDEGKIQEFLQIFVDILDRKIPKMNCIVLQSPPSAGKNFFIDMVCAILVNYGQLGMANRHNLFAFQEAPNKRLIIWNEPNYEPAMTDTIKMMMAGDPYTVRVKHSADTAVAKTPVIVMTNNTVPFMRDAAFNDRIRVFNWKAAYFLKEINYKPHPVSFFNLLNKYNIQF